MRLTIEDHPERIKRYGHIKPAPSWGSGRCSAKCPGTSRTCSLLKRHTGLHVAHEGFRKVVAVWDDRAEAPGPGQVVKKALRRVPGSGSGDKGSLFAPGAFRKRLMARIPSIEEVFLLVLGLAMAGFAIDWALRIIGFW